jgi:hypothetical protein
MIERSEIIVGSAEPIRLRIGGHVRASRSEVRT